MNVCWFIKLVCVEILNLVHIKDHTDYILSLWFSMCLSSFCLLFFLSFETGLNVHLKCLFVCSCCLWVCSCCLYVCFVVYAIVFVSVIVAILGYIFVFLSHCVCVILLVDFLFKHFFVFTSNNVDVEGIVLKRGHSRAV